LVLSHFTTQTFFLQIYGKDFSDFVFDDFGDFSVILMKENDD